VAGDSTEEAAPQPAQGGERLLREPLAAGIGLPNLEEGSSGEAAQPMKGGPRLLREPLAAGIGLQACRLTFTDEPELMRGRTGFEAPAPWWRR
jgi:hypothetical protein